MIVQGESILNITKEKIENYLTDIKNAIQNLTSVVLLKT